jgi:predicted site-specific integrase-resolvase
MENPWMSRMAAVESLGISLSTLCRIIKQGKLAPPHMRRIGRRVLISTAWVTGQSENDSSNIVISNKQNSIMEGSYR